MLNWGSNYKIKDNIRKVMLSGNCIIACYALKGGL